MCGIVISVGLDLSTDRLKVLAKRGPDGEGWFQAMTAVGPLCLGHKRLSITDPSPNGSQPWHDEDRVMVYNGALYDFRARRQSLIDQGHKLRSEGDTEVLAKILYSHGLNGLRDIDGAFAFGFYDFEKKSLILARDRFGEKPLFIYRGRANGRPFVLAGSHQGLFYGLADIDLKLNYQTMSDYLNHGRQPRKGDTFIQGLEKLLPGHGLTIDLSSQEGFEKSLGSAPHLWDDPHHPSYIFNPLPKNETPKSPDEASEQVLHHLTQSVRARIGSTDVPFGACLSGGLDSSLIVSLMHRLGYSPHCVSAIFTDEEITEAPYVEAMRSQFDLRLTTTAPTDNEVADALDMVLSDQGEPFSNASIIAQWFVFKAAQSQGLKVMLDGQGADEIFAGYPPMLGTYLAGQLRRHGPLVLIKNIGDLTKDFSGETAPDLMRQMIRALIPESTRRQALSLIGRFPPPHGIMAYPPPAPEPHLDLNGLCRYLITDSSLPALLAYEDANALGHGVESRVAFLYPPLVQLGLSLEAGWRIRDGWRKAPLRQAAAGLLPPMIVNRRKKLGFSAPHERYMKGAMGSLIKGWINDYKSSSAGTIINRFDGLDAYQSFRLGLYLRWANEMKISL